MQHVKKWKLPWLMVVLLPLLVAARPAPSDNAAQDSKPAASSALPSQAQGGDTSEYAGTEACKTCHEEKLKQLEGTPHWLTTQETHQTHGARGCESCHGPSKEHAESADPEKAGSFKKLSAKEASERCLSCHQGKIEQHEFMRSTHLENEVGCTNCHSIHSSKAEYLLIAKQPQLCYSCHTEQRADFQKTFRHRVNEGLIKCTDCHNAHGTLKDRQVRAAPNQDLICTKCHADKRGPFVYEHEPVRAEGCLACHTPHSSVYPRMLLTARVNTLCLQCHTQIPTGPHSQNLERQSCIICHMSIHGSNVSDIFFK
jgi:DmsE family decaheme c-type cytochrome